MRSSWSRCALIAASLAAGCASGPLSSLRFQNHAPIQVVDDRAPIAKPRETPYRHLYADVDALARRPALHALSVPEPHPALNVNALGEVPDSSWFENRIARRALSPEDIALGPARGRGIDCSAPLRVLDADDNGQPRFVVEDARGNRYILKFNRPSTPELETGPEVVVQRLLWAAGYNVPENEIVVLRPEDLDGSPAGLDAAALAALLARAARTPDGTRFRAMASRYLPGEPIGGYPMQGVRPDDPNDRVPHEDRRDLRGQKLLFAWLGHTDVKEENTLDMWSEHEPGSGKGSVTHYLVDFGKALGVWSHDGDHAHDGFAPHFDYGDAFASLLSFGLWRRPYEAVRAPKLRGLGRFSAAGFDPAAYDPVNPYEPFLQADRFDDYWGAKIVARFRPEHIRAAVRSGRYSNPRTASWIVRALLARRESIVRYALPRVNAIDDPSVVHGGPGRADRVCVRDLAVAHGAVPAWTTRYALQAYDYEGRALGASRTLAAAEDGALCASGLATGASHDGYTMIAVRTWRGERELDPVIVHLARGPSGALRVVGLERR